MNTVYWSWLFAPGWWDIGYNFLIGEDGRVYEGRGWDAVGAHTLGYNSVSIGIAFIGDFRGRSPNAAAIRASLQLISCGIMQVNSRTVFLLITSRSQSSMSLSLIHI